MAKLTLQIYLNAYSDSQSSNNPTMNNFKWLRELDSMIVDNPIAHPLTLAPGETRTIFNGGRTLAQDGTTQYSIALKPLSSNTYVLSATSGTLPNFRTPRTTAADATTQVTVTLNGPLATFASTGGTALNLAGSQVGDVVVIGNQFNTANQGAYKILALTTTSFTVENELGTAEGPITLGSGFATQIQIFSALGVQAGDTLIISGGFSPVTQGSYTVTAVYANNVEFYANTALPIESAIQTQAIAIYADAKQLIYIEADQNCSLNINGSAAGTIEPFVIGSSSAPGVFLRKATMFSLTITNTSMSPANLFVASAE